MVYAMPAACAFETFEISWLGSLPTNLDVKSSHLLRSDRPPEISNIAIKSAIRAHRPPATLPRDTDVITRPSSHNSADMRSVHWKRPSSLIDGRDRVYLD